MQNHTQAENVFLRTAEAPVRRVKIQLVSRSNPDDVRLEIDTGAPDYDPERCGIVDGSVSVDVNREALRSLSLTLVDWTGEWFPGPDRAVWLDAMIRVWKGYAGTQLWPQGIFDVAAPEVLAGRQVRIQGVDKAARALGREEGGFLNPIELPKGLNLRRALEILASHPTWNETRLNLHETDKVLPYTIKCEITDSPWERAVEIANLPGNFRPLYYDENGYLVWAPDPDPNLLAPVWDVWPDDGTSRPGTALPGEFSFLVSASKRIDTSEFRNYVEVVGASVHSVPVRAVAMDNDPNSPTSVSRIGYRIFRWNGGRPDRLITTIEEAQARADYELRRLLRWQERIPLTLTELPVLQPWDVLRLRIPDIDANDTYQVVSFTMPLGPSPEMPVEVWRVRKVVG